MSDEKMVTFLMPDGTKVSNDPRFGTAEALQKQLDSQEYLGHAGTPREEFDAQTSVTHVASLNSGQPGVGENPAPEDPTKDLHGPLGSDAQRIQKEDMEQAAKAGASPKSTSVEDAEPIDSNAEVLKVREARAAAQEKARKAMEKLGDEGEGDPEKPYSEWTGAQLKAEVAKRNADGRPEEEYLVLKSGMKKADVAAMLENDGTPEAPEDEDDSSDDNDDE